MNVPQVIIIVLLTMNVLFVPANNDDTWKRQYCLGMRLARTALWAGLLWWGGFWGT